MSAWQSPRSPIVAAVVATVRGAFRAVGFGCAAAAVVAYVMREPRWTSYAGAAWGLLVWVECLQLRDRVGRLESGR